MSRGSVDELVNGSLCLSNLTPSPVRSSKSVSEFSSASPFRPAWNRPVVQYRSIVSMKRAKRQSAVGLTYSGLFLRSIHRIA